MNATYQITIIGRTGPTNKMSIPARPIKISVIDPEDLKNLKIIMRSVSKYTKTHPNQDNWGPLRSSITKRYPGLEDRLGGRNVLSELTNKYFPSNLVYRIDYMGLEKITVKTLSELALYDSTGACNN